ncbi:MAG: hypothetical protein J7555_05655 [Chloroflexi bacterium]|jgi:hypothetical protein|nr:hypothetical protein [Chloroflexota bacterium]
MDDFLSRVMAEQDVFKKLAANVPGFSGYVERQNRRAADKLLREAVARRFEDLWKRLSSLQVELVQGGQIELLDEIERAALQLRTFTDRIKTAAYGYSGVFDAVKIDAADLDRLYRFDLAFFELANEIEQTIQNLSSALLEPATTSQQIRRLIELSAQANQIFDHRQEVLSGASS